MSRLVHRRRDSAFDVWTGDREFGVISSSEKHLGFVVLQKEKKRQGSCEQEKDSYSLAINSHTSMASKETKTLRPPLTMKGAMCTRGNPMGWPGQDFISLEQLRHDGVSNSRPPERNPTTLCPSWQATTVFRPSIRLVRFAHHVQLKGLCLSKTISIAFSAHVLCLSLIFELARPVSPLFSGPSYHISATAYGLLPRSLLRALRFYSCSSVQPGPLRIARGRQGLEYLGYKSGTTSELLHSSSADNDNALNSSITSINGSRTSERQDGRRADLQPW